MNKKGDVSVTLIVFLALAVILAALFLFSQSYNKSEEMLSDAGFVQKANLAKNIAELYLREAAEDAVYDSYNEIMSKGLYTDNLKFNKNNEVIFSGLDENIDEEFEKEFSSKFKERFKGYSFNEEFLLKLQTLVSQDKFETVLENGRLSIIIKELEGEASSENVKLKYSLSPEVQVSLKELGLEDFSSIYNAKKECLGKPDAGTCFESILINFYVSVTEKELEGEKYFFVDLKSKKEFFVDGEFKKIGFGFANSQ